MSQRIQRLPSNQPSSLATSRRHRASQVKTPTQSSTALARWLFAALTLCAVASLSQLQVVAQDAKSTSDLSNELRNLLQNHWENTSDNDLQLRQWSKGSASTNSALDAYALGLLQLQHHEYRDAAKEFELANRRDPSNPAFLRAYVYNKILIRQPRPIVPLLSQWAQALIDLPADESERTDEGLDSLGLLFGYLEIPTAATVNQRELQQQGEKIRELLNEDQTTLFDQARESVHRLYEALTADRSVELDVATARAEEEQKRELQRLAEDRQRIADSLDELDPQLAQLRADRDEELAAIREDEEPLTESLASLSGQITAAQRDVWNIDQDINSLLFLVSRERDRFWRNRYFLEIQRLQDVLAIRQADLLALQADANVVAARRNVVLQRYRNTRLEYDRSISELESERQQLLRQKKINDVKTDRESQPARASTGKAEALGQKARTLRTYWEFPLQAERRRLLDLE